jgi:hypothetical protein
VYKKPSPPRLGPEKTTTILYRYEKVSFSTSSLAQTLSSIDFEDCGYPPEEDEARWEVLGNHDQVEVAGHLFNTGPDLLQGVQV